jgi:hypothetical protein
MRQFSSSGFRIWNLSREAKLVYTAFGLCSLLGLAVTALLYEDMVGASVGPGGVRAYYAGDRAPDAPPVRPPAPSPAASPAPSGGPAMELPDDEGARPIRVAIPYRKLLEVSHFHLFTVPVFLLIVAHLFMLTGLSSRAKTAWIASAWLSGLAHMGAPWAVRYGGAGWAVGYAATGAALALTATVLTAYPIWAMWRGAPASAS